jgi:hypothetical protein
MTEVRLETEISSVIVPIIHRPVFTFRRNHSNAILNGYVLQTYEEKHVESQRPSLFQRFWRLNDPEEWFCWKCGTILDKLLT